MAINHKNTKQVHIYQQVTILSCLSQISGVNFISKISSKPYSYSIEEKLLLFNFIPEVMWFSISLRQQAKVPLAPVV